MISIDIFNIAMIILQMRVSRQRAHLPSHLACSTKYNHQSSNNSHFVEDNFKDKMLLAELIHQHERYEMVISCDRKLRILRNKYQEFENGKAFHYPRQEARNKVEIFVGSGFKNVLQECFQSYQSGNTHQYVFTSYQAYPNEEEQSPKKYMQDSRPISQSGRQNCNKEINMKTFVKDKKQQISKLESNNGWQSFQQINKHPKLFKRKQMEANFSKKIGPALDSEAKPRQQKLLAMSLKDITNVYIHDSFSNAPGVEQQPFQKQETKLRLQPESKEQDIKEQSQPEKTPTQYTNFIPLQEHKPPEVVKHEEASPQKEPKIADHQDITKNQRIQLDKLTEKHEKQSENFVEITQKAIDSNHSQFFVRYNIKVLEGKRRTTTDVTRISPLKFKRQDTCNKQSGKGIDACPK